MRNTAFAMFFVAANAVGACCSAQNSVYKCGEAYSAQPCPGGTLVRTDDARSPAQASQAESAARRDARLADEMEKGRQKREAQAAPAYIPAPKPGASGPLAPHTPQFFKPKKPKLETKPYTARTAPSRKQAARIQPGPKKKAAP